MKNRISDTRLGQNVSAWIILKEGRQVAKVHALHRPSNTLVNVFDYTQSGWQYSRGGDLNSALSGCIIDGHVLVDDCEVKLYPPEGQKDFPLDFPLPDGYQLYNFVNRRATSCYKIAGLELLTSLGYRVIQAI